MEEAIAFSGTDARGPVDFVLIEFQGDRLTGRAAEALLDLVDRGIVSVYDIMVIGKDASGAALSGRDESGQHRAARQLHRAGVGALRAALRRRRGGGGRGHGARHPRRADRLREHLGDPLHRGGLVAPGDS